MRLLTILFLFFTNSIFAAGYCTDYENVETDVITFTPGVIDLSTLSNCEFAPDGYEITIYEFGMCTEAPGAPTGASAADTSTNCVTIFQSDSGEAFNLAAGVSFDTSSSEKPANGTYTHGYVLMQNTFGITISQEFGEEMGGMNIESGSGIFCASAANNVTGDTTIYGSNHETVAALNQDFVTCSNTRPTATKVTEVLDSFGCLDVSIPATCDFSASGDTDDGAMTAYLVNEATLNGALVDQNYVTDSDRAADRLVGVLAWNSPVIITDSTSEADLQFSVNNGTSAQIHPPAFGGADGYDIFVFGSGPFSLNIQVQ